MLKIIVPNLKTKFNQRVPLYSTFLLDEFRGIYFGIVLDDSGTFASLINISLLDLLEEGLFLD
jgi:hypothetical protein